ncbi:Fibroblast growth factor receptor-like 1 [Leptotrombidium deliense]|uniref:Fibroblast growth factor receptor-like 1 n=1 Tax=Leptotrombidium deliense TaxID=299467 RepID=A0A443RW18_9ACAR|nr:Fibroblast growth factor receptor-like 1 [Leptotrombidium deliense]
MKIIIASIFIETVPPRLVLNKLSEQPLVYPIGANVQLVCPVESSDPDSMFVEWMRNNEPVDEVSRYKITTRGHLKFKDADITDSGVYTCKAINGFGFTKANVTVRVMQESELILMKSSIDNRYPKDNEFVPHEYVAPNEKITPEFFTKTKEVRYVEKYIGSQLKLKCHMSGISNPQINWFKEGRMLTDIDLPIGSLINRGVLFISHLRLTDKGNYSCIAFNEFGQSKASFVVTVKG